MQVSAGGYIFVTEYPQLNTETISCFSLAVLSYLKGGAYAVIRFRCLAEKQRSEDQRTAGLASSGSLLGTLLDLLGVLIEEADEARAAQQPSGGPPSPLRAPPPMSKGFALVAVCENLLSLVGMVGTGGVAVRELKKLLVIVAKGPHWQGVLAPPVRGDGLAHHIDGNAVREEKGYRVPSEGAAASEDAAASEGGGQQASTSPTLAALRHPILRALVAMASPHEDSQLKARPQALWALSGSGSGLRMAPMAWPFTTHEYAACAWVRLQALPKPGERAFLWEFCHNGCGVAAFVRLSARAAGGAEVVVQASDQEHILGPRGDNPGAADEAKRGVWPVPDTVLLPGIWYHIAVRHGPALSGGAIGRGLGMFGVRPKDELVRCAKLPQTPFQRTTTK